MDTPLIVAARLNLARQRPYLSMALWALHPIETPGIGTFGVDKWWRLYWDPELDWDVTTTAAVLYHEIQHLLRLHMERGEGLDGKIWNIAGDAEINDDIRSENVWSLPETVVYPDKLMMKDKKGNLVPMPDELMAEEYYQHVMDNAIKISVPDDMLQPGGGNCGSAADGQTRPWESDQEGGEAGRKISNAEGKLIGRKIAEDIQQRQKSRGDVPGHWQRWADAVINPKVDWRRELKSVVTNYVAEIVGMWNYTYRRPGRRSSAFGDVVMPAMTQPTVKVAVVIDTSGSMGEDELATCLGEVKGILSALGIQEGVSVLSCDADVNATQRVFSANQVKLAGGGGTDMRVGINAATELRPKPDIIVVLTDGYTPWPDERIKQKLVIGVIGEEGQQGGWNTPEWAKTIYIPNH